MDQRPPLSGMKTALQDLAGKGLIYGLGASFNGLVGFLLIPFFTSRLTAREYGRFAIAEMVLNLMLVLLSLGMNVAILARYPSVPPGDRDKFLRSVLTLMALWTAAFEAAFLGIARLAGATVLPVLDMRMFLLIAAITALETLWLLAATFYRAQGAAWRYVGASALQAGIGLLATIYVIAELGYRDEGILIGRLAGDVILCLAVLAPQLRRYRPTLDLGPARGLLKIGVPLIPATFASMWVLTSPRYFIQWYGSVADVGVFAMSSKIAGVLQILYIQPFAMAWMVSLFTIFKEPDAPRIYARVLTYYVLFGLVLALAVGLVAQVAVPILSRQSFPLSATIVLTVALAQVASGLMYPLNIGSYVLEQTRKQVPIFVFSGILITGVGIVMVRLWGAPGGALALLLVYVVQAVLLARMSQRLYHVAFEWDRIAKVLGALGTAFLLVRALGLLTPLFPFIPWILAPLFVAATVLALLAFRFPNPGELAGVRAAAGRLGRGP